LEKIEQKKCFKREFSNFWFGKRNVSEQFSLIYRERNGSKHDIAIQTKIDQSENDFSITYIHDGIATKNIYELLLKTTLAEQMFKSYPQQYIAVTKELLELPYEQQPWFRGMLFDAERKSLTAGNVDIIL